LTDGFCKERSAQPVLLYISLDVSEEQQDKFLKELPKRCLFLNLPGRLQQVRVSTVPGSLERMTPSPAMVDLFFDKVLVKNNKDRDEMDTEREIILRLQNRILMLFFGSGDCERCQDFAPTLKDFFKKLTDEFYVERSAQLVLLYISLDISEEQQDKFLKELPKRCLFLPFQDAYR
ncbi:nucleoredoxin-like protein 1, partial [Clarias magur]